VEKLILFETHFDEDNLLIQINLLFLIGTFAVLLPNAVACGRHNIAELVCYKPRALCIDVFKENIFSFVFSTIPV